MKKVPPITPGKVACAFLMVALIIDNVAAIWAMARSPKVTVPGILAVQAVFLVIWAIGFGVRQDNINRKRKRNRF